jgi:DNA mismatch repair ATPase MutS
VTQTVKEDKSVFSLYDFTSTNGGRDYLRQMMSSPTDDYEEILKRQNFTKKLCEWANKNNGKKSLEEIQK